MKSSASRIAARRFVRARLCIPPAAFLTFLSFGCASVNERHELQTLAAQGDLSRKAERNFATGLEKDKLLARGYAVIDVQKGQTHPQRRVMAIRASKLDAYRNLAEQVYGVFLESNSSMKDSAILSENVKGRVQGLLYGSKVEEINPIGKDSYETTLSLDREIVDELVMRYRNAQDTRSKRSEIDMQQIVPGRLSRPKWDFNARSWRR